MKTFPVLSRRTLLGVGAALGAAPWLVHAQTAWPTRPVRIVVPFPPGGTTDAIARLLATELSSALGQPFVVENKPGAGTVIGVDSVAKSEPDGYTFVGIANSFVVNQTLVRNLPYDTLGDLQPVAQWGLSHHVLCTHPDSGLRSLADLREQARSRNLSFASFGTGTSPHLAGEQLKLLLDMDLVHVPYKGQGPALIDLIGGQVTVMFSNWPEARGHIAAGKLVPLGMATAERASYAPDIPTLTEQGAPIESNSWFGLLAPAAVPQAIVQRLNTEINKALIAPVVTQFFEQGAITSLAGTRAQFADFLRDQIDKYAEIIRRAGIEQVG